MFDKDTDGCTKNDHFADVLLQAHERDLNPQMVCFDSRYDSIENLKSVRVLGWHFSTRLKSNRHINVNRSGLQAVAQAGLCGGDGTVVWLKGFGQIKVFRVRATDDAAEYRAASLDRMSEAERMDFAKSARRSGAYGGTLAWSF